ncbi:hypothetical protein K2Y11_15140 [bacterium]|nr:hypothetical protein [bacterium]
MPSNKSFDSFLRSVNERFNLFRSSLSEMMKILSLEDRNRKIEAVKEVLLRIDDLRRTVSSEDFPVWGPVLESRLNWYIQVVATNDTAGRELLKTILDVNPEIQKQQWNFDDYDGNPIDFAAIYEEYYRSSPVPDLFDQLIAQLQELIDSGEIDSNKSLQALRNLIATIKKNSRRDQYSTVGTWQVVRHFLGTLGLEGLEAIPAIAPVVKAIRRTVDELDLEVPNVCQKIRDKLSEVAAVYLPMLKLEQLALPYDIDNIHEQANS